MEKRAHTDGLQRHLHSLCAPLHVALNASAYTVYAALACSVGCVVDITQTHWQVEELQACCGLGGAQHSIHHCSHLHGLALVRCRVRLRAGHNCDDGTSSKLVAVRVTAWHSRMDDVSALVNAGRRCSICISCQDVWVGPHVLGWLLSGLAATAGCCSNLPRTGHVQLSRLLLLL